MKNKGLIVKRIIAFTVFVCLMALCIFKTYQILRWKDTTGEYISSVDQLYKTDKNKIDAIFVGSSHVYCGVYPAFIWEETGIPTFDMAVSGMDPDSAYHYIKEVYKTQSPKVVCVDLYPLAYDKSLAVESNIYRNMLSMKTSSNSLSLLKDYFGNEDFKDYIFRWPIIHTRYKELEEYDFNLNPVNDFVRGENVVFNTEEIEPPASADMEFNPGNLTEENEKWLNDLYNLSIEYNFELCLFVAPYNTDAAKQEQIDAAAMFASERSIAFIDFNKMNSETGIDYKTDYIDDNHLNALGAEKLSRYLGNFLKDTYGLSDKRGQSGYEQWDEDLAYFYHLEKINKMENAETFDELIDAVESGKDEFSAVISLEFDIAGTETDYYTPLSKLGMSKEDYLSGGKWLYKDGKLTKLIDNDVNAEKVIYPLSNKDTLIVKFSGDGAEENVMINNEDYSARFTISGVVVYDETLDKTAVFKTY